MKQERWDALLELSNMPFTRMVTLMALAYLVGMMLYFAGYGAVLAWSQLYVHPRRSYPWYQPQLFERDTKTPVGGFLYRFYGGELIMLTEDPE